MRWPPKLAAMAGAALAALSAISMLAARGRVQKGGIEAPAVIAIRPTPYQYQLAGEFTRGAEPVDVPARTVRLDRAVVIMVHQVTAADYQRCVGDQACPLAPEVGESSDRPAVNVSWHDAVAYAAWLSHESDARYRLPTDEEWAFAAGRRFRGDPSPARGGLGPAQRWLAQYELEAGGDAAVASEPQPIGAFGTNENGVVDLAGNVWEWTSTYFTHHILDRTGADAPIVNCGVRVAEGRHRAYLPDFIRDPRGGGCSTGLPPKNLGFRLVRESTRLFTRAGGELSQMTGWRHGKLLEESSAIAQSQIARSLELRVDPAPSRPGPPRRSARPAGLWMVYRGFRHTRPKKKKALLDALDALDA